MMVAAAVAILAGCEKGGGEAAKGGAPAAPKYESLSGDAVVMSVNGAELTKAQIEDEVDYRAALVKIARPKTSDKSLERYNAKNRHEAFDEFVSRQLLLGEAKKNGVKVDDAARTSVEGRYRKYFGRSFRDLKTFAEKKFEGTAAGAFLKACEEEMEIEAYLRQCHGAEIAVAPEEMAAARQRCVDYNARASATNRYFAALATNVLAKARAGEDFAALAAKYSFDGFEEHDIDVEHDLSEFAESPELYKAVSSLPVGEISGVLKTKGGHAIVKVLNRIPADGQERDEEAYNLIIIGFPVAVVYPVPETDEILLDLGTQKRSEVVLKTVAGLKAAADIKYPFGRGIVPPMPEKPGRAAIEKQVRRQMKDVRRKSRNKGKGQGKK